MTLQDLTNFLTSFRKFHFMLQNICQLTLTASFIGGQIAKNVILSF